MSHPTEKPACNLLSLIILVNNKNGLPECDKYGLDDNCTTSKKKTH